MFTLQPRWIDAKERRLLHRTCSRSSLTKVMTVALSWKAKVTKWNCMAWEYRESWNWKRESLTTYYGITFERCLFETHIIHDVNEMFQNLISGVQSCVCHNKERKTLLAAQCLTRYMKDPCWKSAVRHQLYNQKNAHADGRMHHLNFKKYQTP